MSTTLTQADKNLNYINDLVQSLRKTFPKAGTILDGGNLDSVLVNFSSDLSGDGVPLNLGVKFRSSHYNSPIAELKLTAEKGSFRWCASPTLHHIELMRGFFDQLFPQAPKPTAPIFGVEPRYDNTDLGSLITTVHLFLKGFTFRFNGKSHLQEVKEFHKNVRVLPKSYTIKLIQTNDFRYQIGIFSGSVAVATLTVNQNPRNPLEVFMVVRACDARATKFTWSNLIGIFGCMEISNGTKIDLKSASFDENGFTNILPKNTLSLASPVYLYNNYFTQGLLQSVR